jgi:hypothetical protein
MGLSNPLRKVEEVLKTTWLEALGGGSGNRFPHQHIRVGVGGGTTGILMGS